MKLEQYAILLILGLPLHTNDGIINRKYCARRQYDWMYKTVMIFMKQFSRKYFFE